MFSHRIEPKNFSRSFALRHRRLFNSGKFYSNYGFLKPNNASDYSPTGSRHGEICYQVAKNDATCYLKKGNCLNNCNHAKQLVVARQVQGTYRLERLLNHNFNVVLPFIVTALGNIMPMRT